MTIQHGETPVLLIHQWVQAMGKSAQWAYCLLQEQSKSVVWGGRGINKKKKKGSNQLFRDVTSWKSF